MNNTSTTESYTLSLHDALPIWLRVLPRHRPEGRRRGRGRQRQRLRQHRGLVQLAGERRARAVRAGTDGARPVEDRKSTRLNSSHSQISYAVFCLKKKITWYNKN